MSRGLALESCPNSFFQLPQDIELEIQVLPGSMDKAWLPNFIESRLKDLLTLSVRQPLLSCCCLCCLPPLTAEMALECPPMSPA